MIRLNFSIKKIYFIHQKKIKDDLKIEFLENNQLYKLNHPMF